MSLSKLIKDLFLVGKVYDLRSTEALIRINTKYCAWKDKRKGFWSAYNEAKRLLFNGADRATLTLVVAYATKASTPKERKAHKEIIKGMLK